MAAAGRARRAAGVALAALVLLAAPRRGHSQAAKAKHPCKADELMKECGLLMDQIKDSSKGLVGREGFLANLKFQVGEEPPLVQRGLRNRV